MLKLVIKCGYMRKTIFFFTSLLLTFILLNQVSAKQGQAQNLDSTEPVKNVKQVQNQEITQNQGEEQNLRIENTLQGEAGEALQEGESIQDQVRSREDALAKMQSKKLTMDEGAEIVRERNNDVANRVHELLIERNESGTKGGIGQQVRVIAQNQLKAQEEVQSRLSNLEERPVWQRFFLGQNQDAVDGLQNALRNKQSELDELQTLLTDSTLSAADRLAAEEAFLELQAQQQLIETHLNNILGEFSVAGFFRKMFGRS